MTLLVDPDEMPAFLAGDISSDDAAAACEWASNAVEAFCGRQFTFVADDVVTVRPFPDRSAQLPNPPITDVTLVEGWMPNPDLSQPRGMVWAPITNYQWTDDGTIYDTTGLPGVTWQCPSWPTLPKSLRVTYSHGFDPIPDAVQSAVYKAAGRYLSNSEGLVSKRIDDVHYVWGGAGAGQDPDDIFGGLLSTYQLVAIL